MQVVFTKIMYYWALSLWTRDKLNKQSDLRRRTADLSSQSTLTEQPEAQPECVGCRGLYWKSFSHLFPQGFCPSTTEALQTLTGARLQQLSGCLDTSDTKGVEVHSVVCFLQMRYRSISTCLHACCKICCVYRAGGGTRVLGLVRFYKEGQHKRSWLLFSSHPLAWRDTVLLLSRVCSHFTQLEVKQTGLNEECGEEYVAVKRHRSTQTVAKYAKK